MTGNRAALDGSNPCQLCDQWNAPQRDVAVVRERRLEENILLIKPEEMSAAMAQAGVERWVSCDAKPPVEGIPLAQPGASRLAALAAAANLTDTADKPLEPLYLEGAFITQAKPKPIPAKSAGRMR